MQSIAVFPFNNISKNKEDDYLCDAIAIEITHLLSNHKNARVVSTITSFSNSVKLDTSNLNVDVFIKGALHKIGERIRITVQFINTQDNTCFLSEKFDESSSNLFEIIDKVSGKILEYLQLEKINQKPAIDSTAYNYYLKGLYHWNLWNENNIKQAISFFNKSIKIEPEFALGYARLSDCWSLLAGIQKGDTEVNYKNARTTALKSIELDENMIEAHLSLALVKLLSDVDILGAFYSLKKAFSLNNKSSEVHYYYAFYLLTIGQYKKAIQNIEYVLETEPFNVQINSTYGYALSLLGEYEKAEQQLKKTLTLSPDSDATYDALVWTYIMSNKYNEAKELVEQNESRIIHSPATQIVLYQQMKLKNRVDNWLEVLISKLNQNKGRAYYREASITYLSLGNNDKGNDYFELFYKEKIGFIMALSHPAWKSFRNSGKFYKYKKRLNLLNPPLLPNEFSNTDEDIIVFHSSTLEKLAINMEELIYIEAQSIYSKIIWNENGITKEKLLRVSLTKILSQTINPNLFRCHNSYIVNTLNTYSLAGNRKSMKLIPKGYSFQIPVSRTKSSSIHQHINIVDSSSK
ncbi:tetratricopeptide repeat protein [Changchengzhania lutea]|uniref:tetratricopeptide repeat protein n=1 Tax=Changchengzhania lutea TaxID=2049305 RepID=UPI00115F073B|nr:tetratricopeptide repeat protein [Changchengzhania lutea]